MGLISYAAATSGSSPSSIGTLINCNYPYYLSSSSHSGMVPVAITLLVHNYNQFSWSIKITLSVNSNWTLLMVLHLNLFLHLICWIIGIGLMTLLFLE